MLEQFQEYIETIKDNEEEMSKVKEALSPLLPEKEVNVEVIKSLYEKDKEIKSFFDSEKDKHASKSLETWKQNNLQKIVNEELLKRNPTKDEKDLRIEEIENKLKAAERAQFEKDMLLELKDRSIEKNVPSIFANLLIADTREQTEENFEKFVATWQSELEKNIGGVYKKEGYNPSQSSNTKTFTLEEISKMSEKEINENWELIQKSLKK